MGMTLSAELFYGIPIGGSDGGDEDLPWGEFDSDDWLASLYGWTEDDGDVWNFLARLPIELVYGGQLEYYSEYAVAARGTVVTAYGAKPVSGKLGTITSQQHKALVNFCERTGFNSADIGWHVMPCYG